MTERSAHPRQEPDKREASPKQRDHEPDLSETRPTPGSAEGERDVETQSDSNVPRRGSDGGSDGPD